MLDTTQKTNSRAAAIAALAVTKAANRARYERRYARHVPSPKVAAKVARPFTPRERLQCVMRGIPQYLQQVVRMQYGAKGTWGHGLQPSGTTKGPGIRPLSRLYREADGSPLLNRVHPAGTKLVRAIIRTSHRESTYWRLLYRQLTGKPYDTALTDEDQAQS